MPTQYFWAAGDSVEKKSDKQQPKNKTVDATKMLFSPTTYFGM